jgi:lycopene cyclase domain-containing protein
MNSLYLWINIATFTFPLLLSFDKKVAFYKKWPTLLPAIGITGLVFLIWDQWFAVMDVWGFNAVYLTGYYLSSGIYLFYSNRATDLRTE